MAGTKTYKCDFLMESSTAGVPLPAWGKKSFSLIRRHIREDIIQQQTHPTWNSFSTDMVRLKVTFDPLEVEISITMWFTLGLDFAGCGHNVLLKVLYLFLYKNNNWLRIKLFMNIISSFYWWPVDDSRTYGNSHEVTAFCCRTTNRIGCSTPTSGLSTLTAKFLLI